MRDVLQNSTTPFKAYMVDSSTKEPKTDLVAGDFTVLLAQPGLASVAFVLSITNAGEGWYEITPLASNRSTFGDNGWTVKATGCDPYPMKETVVAYDASDSGSLGLSALLELDGQLTGIDQNLVVVMAQIDAVDDAVELIGTDVDDLSDDLDSYYSLLSAPLGKLEDTVQDDGSGTFQFTVASHALIGGGSGGDGETVYVITIPAIEADAIQAGIQGEVTRYRGTQWTIAVEGLASQPTKCYCTVKRGGEPDAKAVLQVTNTDGLVVLHGSANGIDSSQASITFQTYDDDGTTKYRAIATFQGEATAEVTPNRYKIDFKEVDTPAELAVARLIVEKPVTDAVS